MSLLPFRRRVLGFVDEYTDLVDGLIQKECCSGCCFSSVDIRWTLGSDQLWSLGDTTRIQEGSRSALSTDCAVDVNFAESKRTQVDEANRDVVVGRGQKSGMVEECVERGIGNCIESEESRVCSQTENVSRHLQVTTVLLYCATWVRRALAIVLLLLLLLLQTLLALPWPGKWSSTISGRVDSSDGSYTTVTNRGKKACNSVCLFLWSWASPVAVSIPHSAITIIISQLSITLVDTVFTIYTPHNDCHRITPPLDHHLGDSVPPLLGCRRDATTIFGTAYRHQNPVGTAFSTRSCLVPIASTFLLST